MSAYTYTVTLKKISGLRGVPLTTARVSCMRIDIG